MAGERFEAVAGDRPVTFDKPTPTHFGLLVELCAGSWNSEKGTPRPSRLCFLIEVEKAPFARDLGCRNAKA